MASDLVGLGLGALTTGLAAQQYGSGYSGAMQALQSAQAAIGKIQDPNLQALIQPLQQAVWLGQITPEDAIAAVQQQSAANGIQVPPEILNDQYGVLNQLHQVAQQGYTPEERAQIAQTMSQVQTQNRGSQEAIENDLRSRGQWGSGSELASREQAQQGYANQASQQGLSIAADARTRALAALAQEGQLSTAMNTQNFGQQNTLAQEQNQISQFNAQNQQQTGLTNAAAQNTAALTAQQQAYGVQQQNIQSQQAMNTARVNAGQQQFANALNQGTAQANVLSNAAHQSAQMGQNWIEPMQKGITALGAGGATYLSKTFDKPNADTTNKSADTWNAGGPALAMGTSHVGMNDRNQCGGRRYEDGTPMVYGPGGAFDDEVPAHLSRGEAVLNKPAAEMMGRENIDDLNHEAIGALMDRMTGGKHKYDRSMFSQPDAIVQVAVPEGSKINEKEALRLALEAMSKEKEEA